MFRSEFSFKELCFLRKLPVERGAEFAFLIYLPACAR